MNDSKDSVPDQADTWEERVLSEADAIQLGYNPCEQYGTYFKVRGHDLLYNPMVVEGGMSAEFVNGKLLEEEVEVDMGVGEEGYLIYRELGGKER